MDPLRRPEYDIARFLQHRSQRAAFSSPVTTNTAALAPLSAANVSVKRSTAGSGIATSFFRTAATSRSV